MIWKSQQLILNIFFSLITLSLNRKYKQNVFTSKKVSKNFAKAVLSFICTEMFLFFTLIENRIDET